MSMNKRQYIITAVAAIAGLILAGCTDLTDLDNRVKDLEGRMTKVEGLVKSANESISALQKLIDAQSKNMAVKDYRKLEDGSGYVLVMSDGEEIVVRSGKMPQISMIEEDGVLYWAIDGKIVHDATGNPIPAKGPKGDPGADGITPQVRVSADGYWEVSIDNGATWKPILDADGKKVKAKGEKGEPGEPGLPGADGNDGADGITPQVRVSTDGYWEVSIDNGTTWKPLLDADGKKVKAQGEKGEPGTPGLPGADGNDGADGITPQLRVDADGYWEVSLDNGTTWQSVLDVNGQKVKARATTADLQITEDDESVTIVYNGKTFVLPKAPKVVPATGIRLTKTSAELDEGETLELFYKLEPSDATTQGVTWASDNTDIATVDEDGIVTAVKAGTATITVSVKGQPEIKATCTITVKSSAIAVTKLTLSESSAEVSVGKTLTLTCTIEPTNATNKELVWSTSNETIATVDAQGVVTGVKAGTVTITVASKSDPSVKATCTVTVVGETSIDDVPVVGL